MAAPNSASVSVDSGHMVPAFAKLQGLNSEHFMRKYSIILGCSTETCKVDFDLSELDEGRGPPVSCHHARIFYDFEHHHFALEVLGRTGCKIRGLLYLPGSDPVKLNSQDLIEICGKQFYFLLPPRSIFDITTDPAGTHGECDKDTENQLLLEVEKDAVSFLIVLISDICSPGEWVPMKRLHSELLERFGDNWPRVRVRMYLPEKDGSGSSTETEGRPWRNLLPLLRKYPEHFVMSTVTRGEVTLEYVALVSPASLGNGDYEP